MSVKRFKRTDAEIIKQMEEDSQFCHEVPGACPKCHGNFNRAVQIGKGTHYACDDCRTHNQLSYGWGYTEEDMTPEAYAKAEKSIEGYEFVDGYVPEGYRQADPNCMVDNPTVDIDFSAEELESLANMFREKIAHLQEEMNKDQSLLNKFNKQLAEQAAYQNSIPF